MVIVMLNIQEIGTRNLQSLILTLLNPGVAGLSFILDIPSFTLASYSCSLFWVLQRWNALHSPCPCTMPSPSWNWCGRDEEPRNWSNLHQTLSILQGTWGQLWCTSTGLPAKATPMKQVYHALSQLWDACARGLFKIIPSTNEDQIAEAFTKPLA